VPLVVIEYLNVIDFAIEILSQYSKIEKISFRLNSGSPPKKVILKELSTPPLLRIKKSIASFAVF
jgi:hypothetical protein